jgi:hypothetical protein
VRALQRRPGLQHDALRGPREAAARVSRYASSMCLICIELDKNAMTWKEGRRALGEMRVKLDAKHVEEVEKKLDVAEAEAEKAPAP